MEGQFTYGDGEPVPEHTQTIWAENNPATDPNNSEDCIVYIPSQTLTPSTPQWSDYECQFEFAYICQYTSKWFSENLYLEPSSSLSFSVLTQSASGPRQFASIFREYQCIYYCDIAYFYNYIKKKLGF